MAMGSRAIHTNIIGITDTRYNGNGMVGKMGKSKLNIPCAAPPLSLGNQHGKQIIATSAKRFLFIRMLHEFLVIRERPIRLLPAITPSTPTPIEQPRRSKDIVCVIARRYKSTWRMTMTTDGKHQNAGEVTMSSSTTITDSCAFNTSVMA